MHKQCLSNKFFKMAHAIFENQAELGFSDENLRKVKDLKLDTKKSLIKVNAEVETIAVDIMSKLWDDSPDMAEIAKLLDRKYTLKKESMKELLSAFVTLKKMLSKEQLRKLHSLCKAGSSAEEKERSCCQ
ncbi:MAG: hypothetical protein Q7K98_06680 [Candidatus Omnitrophota bacterium]|nr:hypothetical protein [Candidatus Omnitrophota bacterium]